MNAYECALINEYGAILPETVGCTPQDTEQKVIQIIGIDWKNKGCCICQLIPIPVIGKPFGYWLDDTRKIKIQE